MKRKREFFASGPPSGLPDPPKCVRIEIVDSDEAREIAESTNRILCSGETVHLENSWTGPVVAKVNGVDVYKLTPAPGQRPTWAGVDLDDSTYRHIIDSGLGYDDDGSAVSTAWRDEARAALQAAMKHPAPQHGIFGFMKTHAVYLDNLASLARSFGLSPAETSAAIGAPVRFPRRSLLPPCGKARALEAEAARKRALEEAKRPVAVKVAPPKMNTKTLRELGLQAVLVPLGSDPECSIPRTFESAGNRTGRNPTWYVGPGEHWKVGYRVEGFTFASAVFAWPTIVGLDLEAEDLTFGGSRWLPPSFVLEAPEPVLAGVLHASVEIAQLVTRLRRRVMPDADRGPIEPSKFGKTGIARAKKILAGVERQLRHTAVSVATADAWELPHAIEAVVRGCLVHPTEAVALALEVQGKPAKRRAGEPPAPKFRRGIEEIGRWAAAAAMGGEITPGSLLSNPQKKGR